MKAISLWQPWASLIAIGAKRLESRSWSTPYRGPMAIHAAKRWTEEERSLCGTEPFQSTLEQGGLVEREQFGILRAGTYVPEGYRLFHSLPLGAIVAVCHLIACLPITRRPLRGQRSIAVDDEGIVRDWRPQLPVMEHVGIGEDFGEHERDFGDYSPGRFAWVLAEIQRLPEPIPYRGQRRLWDLEPEIVELIGAQSRVLGVKR